MRHATEQRVTDPRGFGTACRQPSVLDLELTQGLGNYEREGFDRRAEAQSAGPLRTEEAHFAFATNIADHLDRNGGVGWCEGKDDGRWGDHIRCSGEGLRRPGC